MITIRAMELDDVDKVFAMECRAHIEPWGFDIFYNCILAGFDCRVLELVDESSSQGTIVGYLVGRYNEQECHLLNLCVDPAMHGRGFGRFLMDDLIASLETKTNATILLEVRPSNNIALSLYNKLGFVHVGVREAYYDDGQGDKEDAWVLRKVVKE